MKKEKVIEKNVSVRLRYFIAPSSLFPACPVWGRNLKRYPEADNIIATFGGRNLKWFQAKNWNAKFSLALTLRLTEQIKDINYFSNNTQAVVCAIFVYYVPLSLQFYHIWALRPQNFRPQNLDPEPSELENSHSLKMSEILNAVQHELIFIYDNYRDRP